MSTNPTGHQQWPPGERWERTFGGHAMRFEPPDILVACITGDIDEADMAVIVEEVTRFGSHLPHFYELVDMSRMSIITPAARKVAATAKNPLNGSIVVFGVSFTQRVFVQLMYKAARLISGAAPPLVTFETENEARAWIEEHRRARSRKAGTL